MKVSKEIYDLSEDILNEFDPDRMKQREIEKIKSENTSASSKWDQMEKEMDKEERLEQVQNTDFKGQANDLIHKQMGCARDHAVELDIYNKPYPEKIKRIGLMKEQGNLAMKALGGSDD